MIAGEFGASDMSDSVILALTLPELMSSILATGIASQFIVPRLQKVNSRSVNDFLNEAWRKFALISFLGFFLFNFFSLFYFETNVFVILAISSLAILPNTMSAITSAYLSFHEKFLSQSTSNIIFNIVATTSILVGTSLFFIASGFLFAAVLRFFWIWRDAFRMSVPLAVFSPFGSNLHTDLKLKSLLIALFGGSIAMVNPMVDRLVASSLIAGSVSILSYAEKLYILPISVFIAPYMLSSFPTLSRHQINPGRLIFKMTFPVLGFSFLLAVGGYLFSEIIVGYSYGLTGISNFDQILIRNTFIAYLPSLIFTSCSMLFVNIFFSLQLEKVIMIFAILSVVLNAAGDFLVIYFNGSSVHLALVTSLVSLTVFLYQFLFLFFTDIRKNNGIHGNRK